MEIQRGHVEAKAKARTIEMQCSDTLLEAMTIKKQVRDLVIGAWRVHEVGAQL